jgi:hypothetical protein
LCTVATKAAVGGAAGDAAAMEDEAGGAGIAVDNGGISDPLACIGQRRVRNETELISQFMELRCVSRGSNIKLGVDRLVEGVGEA